MSASDYVFADGFHKHIGQAQRRYFKVKLAKVNPA